MNPNFDKIHKTIEATKLKLDHVDKKHSRSIKDIKDLLEKLDAKITLILSKIEEFEFVMDAAEELEEYKEEQDEMYNTEWNPYDDDDYQPEEYEKYDDDEEEF